MDQTEPLLPASIETPRYSQADDTPSDAPDRAGSRQDPDDRPPEPQHTTTQIAVPEREYVEDSDPQQPASDVNQTKLAHSQEKPISPAQYRKRLASYDSGTLHALSFYNIVEAWRWELITWIFGSLSFFTIFTLLLRFHNKPLEKWKGPPQISTVVAVLAGAAQSALMVSVSSCIGQLKWFWFRGERRAIEMKRFDDASRGPSGSLRLLLDLLWRKPRPFLVALGALMTILMLGFAPFAQQACAIQMQLVNRSNSAIISYATTYMPPIELSGSYLGSGSSPPGGGTAGFGNSTSGAVDLVMAAAINAGIYDRFESLNDVTGSCPTSACTWPIYDTLAICASTPEDITSTIIDLGGQNGPNGLRFSVPALVNSPLTGSANLEDIITFWMESLYLGGDQLPISNISYQNLPVIAEIFVLFASPCNTSYDDVNNKSAWTAFRATLNLCVQKLNSSYVDGSIHTTVLETYFDTKWQQQSQEHEPLFLCTEQNGGPDRYCIGSLDILGAQIASAFNGSASLIPGGDNLYSALATEALATDILGSDPTQCDGSSNVGITGFGKRMNTIALALTNAIRTGQNSTNMSGASWANTPYILVDFRWLALPAIIYIGITILLFATALWAEVSESPLWKSSLLVLLWCMNPDNQVASGEEADNDARLLNLHLQKNEKGWQLVDTGSEK